jgi:hypothetical protein
MINNGNHLGFLMVLKTPGVRVKAMLLNATFNNISVTSWQSVLLVKETGVPVC